jgi:magnesium-transporting ATPase (P-type)
MTVAVPSREEGAVVRSPVTAAEAAAPPADDVLARLGSGPTGQTEDEAARRLRAAGPNAVRSHRVHALSVLASQLRSPLLILLAVTALASAFLGASRFTTRTLRPPRRPVEGNAPNASAV